MSILTVGETSRSTWRVMLWWTWCELMGFWGLIDLYTSEFHPNFQERLLYGTWNHMQGWNSVQGKHFATVRETARSFLQSQSLSHNCSSQGESHWYDCLLDRAMWRCNRCRLSKQQYHCHECSSTNQRTESLSKVYTAPLPALKIWRSLLYVVRRNTLMYCCMAAILMLDVFIFAFFGLSFAAKPSTWGLWHLTTVTADLFPFRVILLQSILYALASDRKLLSRFYLSHAPADSIAIYWRTRMGNFDIQNELEHQWSNALLALQDCSRDPLFPSWSGQFLWAAQSAFIIQDQHNKPGLWWLGDIWGGVLWTGNLLTVVLNLKPIQGQIIDSKVEQILL